MIRFSPPLLEKLKHGNLRPGVLLHGICALGSGKSRWYLEDITMKLPVLLL